MICYNFEKSTPEPSDNSTEKTTTVTTALSKVVSTGVDTTSTTKLLMFRKRMNENCSDNDDDDEEEEEEEEEEESKESLAVVVGQQLKQQQQIVDSESESTLISCEHIAHLKEKYNGNEVYHTMIKIFVIAIGEQSRKIKARYWRCSHESCEGMISSRLHACMYCHFTGCYTLKHIHDHFDKTGHNLAMDASFGYVYCFSCDNYIFDDHFEGIMVKLKRMAGIQNPIEYPYKWEPSLKDEYIFNQFVSGGYNSHSGYNGLRGLINLGSTCFMNCILQTLVHTPPFRDHFLGNEHSCRREPSTCLGCQMAKLVGEFYSGKITPYIPDKLLYLVWTHAKHLAGYEQQDAHEFFISTLDLLHRHSSEVKTGTDTSTGTNTKKCDCIIDQIFTGSLQSDLVCQSCGGVSSVEDPIWDFSLDLANTTNTENSKNLNNNPNDKSQKTLSLNDCLELFTRTEHLGSSAKTKCNKCESYQESTKQLSLKKLPVVVSFHLKRFEQTNRLNKKISTFVSFPPIIDMTPFTTWKIGYRARTNTQLDGDDDSMDSTPRLNWYSLFAVVNHSGTLETGHYTVFVKCGGSWFKCDDHFVIKSTETEVLNSEGYLLFYLKNLYEFGPSKMTFKDFLEYSGFKW